MNKEMYNYRIYLTPSEAKLLAKESKTFKQMCNIYKKKVKK